MTESSLTNPEIEAIRQRIAEAELRKQLLLDEVAERQKGITRFGAEIDKIRKEANDRISELAVARSKIEEDIFDTRREIRALNSELDILQNNLRLAIDKLQQSLLFKKKAIEFDDLTAGLKWREWAFDYQVEGARIMASNKRTINGDTMGLGKTLMSLMTCDMLKAERILIIAPGSVIPNFTREVLNWAPHRIPLKLYSMSKIERNANISLLKAVGGPAVVLINYEAWRKDLSLVEQLKELRFDTVICDEFHAIKNMESIAARGVEKIVLANNICPSCGGYTTDEKKGLTTTCKCIMCGWSDQMMTPYRYGARRSVKNVFPMSGTPILNRPQELFIALHLTLPEIFYSERVFLNMYCMMNDDGKWVWQRGGLQQLQHHLSGHYIARNKKDVGIQLPPQTPQIVELEFDKELYSKQWEIKEQLRKHAQIILESGDKLDAMAVIALITRERQANVYPAGIKIKEKIRRPDGGHDLITVFDAGTEVQESVKLDYAFDLIKNFTADGDHDKGERGVVYSQFVGPLHELARRLQKDEIDVVVMDGSTSATRREEIQLDFDRKVIGDNPYKFQVLLTNYKTGGQGINLTACTQIVVLDEAWNPGTHNQAVDRVNRIGQTEESTVTIIRIKDSIDTWLADLIETKKNIVDGFAQIGKEITSGLLDAMRSGDYV